MEQFWGQKRQRSCVSETSRIWEVMLGVVWSPLKNIYTAEIWFTAHFTSLKDLVALCVEDVLKMRINCESHQSSSKPWIWYCSPRVFEVHQLWIFTEILMSAFYYGNEGKIKCASCLLLDISSQRTTKGVAVCDMRRLTRMGQACHIGWLCASWLFLPRVQRARGDPEKRKFQIIL